MECFLKKQTPPKEIIAQIKKSCLRLIKKNIIFFGVDDVIINLGYVSLIVFSIIRKYLNGLLNAKAP